LERRAERRTIEHDHSGRLRLSHVVAFGLGLLTIDPARGSAFLKALSMLPDILKQRSGEEWVAIIPDREVPNSCLEYVRAAGLKRP
jgi:hypothetical protein